jgi:hypothetical protein
MDEQEIKALMVKAMDDDTTDEEAKAAFAGVLANVAINVKRIADALDRLAPKAR